MYKWINKCIISILVAIIIQPAIAMNEPNLKNFKTINLSSLKEAIINVPKNSHWKDGQRQCFYVLSWVYRFYNQEMTASLEIDSGFINFAPPLKLTEFISCRMPKSSEYTPEFCGKDIIPTVKNFMEIVKESIDNGTPLLVYCKSKSEERITLTTIIGYRDKNRDNNSKEILLIDDKITSVKITEFINKTNLFSVRICINSAQKKNFKSEFVNEISNQLRILNVIKFKKSASDSSLSDSDTCNFNCILN